MPNQTIRPSIIIKIILAIILIIFAIKPYNIFCNLTEKCDGFYPKYFFKKTSLNEEIKINLLATNYIENLNFSTKNPVIYTATNRITEAEFIIQNTGTKSVNFTIELSSTPQDFSQKIDLLQCLCSKEYKLKPGEEKKLKMKFAVKEHLDHNYIKTNNITLKFTTRKNIKTVRLN